MPETLSGATFAVVLFGALLAASALVLRRWGTDDVPDTFVVTTPRGQPVMKAAFGTENVLKEGQYLFQTTYGGRNFSQPFWINTDATTAVVFDASKVGVDETAEAGVPRPAPVAGNPTGAKPAPNRPAPPAGAKKFCTSCGAPLAATARFCTKCGAKTGG